MKILAKCVWLVQRLRAWHKFTAKETEYEVTKEELKEIKNDRYLKYTVTDKKNKAPIEEPKATKEEEILTPIVDENAKQ